MMHRSRKTGSHQRTRQSSAAAAKKARNVEALEAKLAEKDETIAQLKEALARQEAEMLARVNSILESHGINPVTNEKFSHEVTTAITEQRETTTAAIADISAQLAKQEAELTSRIAELQKFNSGYLAASAASAQSEAH